MGDGLPSDYLADDESFVDLSEDEILETEDGQFYVQSEGVTTWRLVGLHDDEGRLLPVNQLKKEPPVFRVTSSDGAVAEFLVTKNLSKSLVDVFDEVHRGYYGVSARRRSDADKFESLHEKLVEWTKSHPFGVVMISIVFALVLYSMVV